MHGDEAEPRTSGKIRRSSPKADRHGRRVGFRKMAANQSRRHGAAVYPLASKEAGVCGAAMLGASALTGKSLSSLSEKFVKTKPPYIPREGQKAEYDKIFERYKKLYKTVKELSI